MKLAFTVPFFGEAAAGGAEAECRRTIQHLRAEGHEIEVFTTTLLDLNQDWSVPWHAAGTQQEQGLPVHRYPVERVYTDVLSGLNQQLQHGDVLSPDDENTFAAQHVSSCSLLRALANREADFDAFCFMPYCYGTTLYGARLFPEKTILIPCLHDEGYARLNVLTSIFQHAARVVFHSRAEQSLAERLYGNRPEAYRLIGEGVDLEFEANASRFRDKYDMPGPFALCVGRKDPSKNTPALVQWYEHYVHSYPDGAQLVFIGPGTVSIPDHLAGRVRDLGYVPRQDKYDAYAAASVLVNPSVNESFSLVLMESWACGTPALVHADCAVTREHVTSAEGGLYAHHGAEFALELNWLLRHPERAARMGRSGSDYARRRFAWPCIMEAWREQVLDAFS